MSDISAITYGELVKKVKKEKKEKKNVRVSGLDSYHNRAGACGVSIGYAYR